MLKTILIGCFTCLLIPLWAQDTLWVQYVSPHGLTARMAIDSGKTVYGTTQKLGGHMAQTFVLNPERQLSAIRQGEILRFYVNPQIIAPHRLSPRSIPVCYRVSAKETLFTIAKKYAQKDVDLILHLNKKHTQSLSIGETLLLGYWDDRKAALVSLPPQHNMHNRTVIFKKERGIALCEGGESGELNDLVVMHAVAPVNSEIHLYNPMLKRGISATVVGKLPPNTFDDHITVVISPSVAEALGALDKRFLVEMTYPMIK